MSYKKTSLAAGAAGLLMIGAAAWGDPVMADYGNAPDPSFPSLFASSGPYHTDVSKIWIGGGTTSTTTTEPDASATDSNDGLGRWVKNGVQTFFATRISFDASKFTPSASNRPFLNVLGDFNGNGTWDPKTGANPDEWAIQNFRVPLDLLPPGLNTLTVMTQVATGIDPASLINHYTRVTLSDTPASNKTSQVGSFGGFELGETEDWIGQVLNGGAIGDGVPSTKTPPSLAMIGAPNGPCDICGELCIGTPGHGKPGDPAPGWSWDLTIPAGTTSLNVQMTELSVDGGQKLCPDSFLQVPAALGGNQLGVNNWSNNLIAGAPALGGTYRFSEYGGLLSKTGHTTVQFHYDIKYDPDNEFIHLEGYSYYGNLGVPAPSAITGGGGLLAGMMVFALWRHRRAEQARE